MRCSTLGSADFMRVPLPAAMITTLSAMRISFFKACAIICLTLLSACSTLRLAYNTGPQLAWWWIDGYVDFNNEQAPRVKESLAQWFSWARETQLPEVAALLASAAVPIMEPTTPAQACRWSERTRQLAEPALDRALVLAAEHVPTLTKAQLAQIEQRQRKSNTEMREEQMQADANERSRAAVKRAVERAERLYGKLGEAQRRVIAVNSAASPFDPALSMAEREKRQAETLQTLRRLASDRPGATQTVAALRQLVDQAEHSPRADYRAYQQRLAEHGCVAAAELHNSTTPAQRQAARKQLKEWEDDVRVLMAERTQ